MTATVLGVTLIIIGMVALMVRRSLQMRKLAAAGVTAQAEVLKIWHHSHEKGPTRHRVRYCFLAANGQHYRNTVMITGERRARLAGLTHVAVVYLPNNPKVSALGEDVAGVPGAHT